MFFKIGVLTNFAIFTGKHLCWSLFLIKLETFNCFPENKVKFFVSSFFYETPPVATSADVFFYIMFWKRRCWIYCIYIFHNSFILKPNITLIRVHSISFIVPLVGIGRTTCCFRFHLLLLVAIHYHLLSHFATSCYSLYHSLSFVVTCCTCCYWLSLLVTRCTIHLTFYKRSSIRVYFIFKDVWSSLLKNVLGSLRELSIGQIENCIYVMPNVGSYEFSFYSLIYIL